MSAPVSADPQKPRGWRRIFRGRFLVFSIIFHVLLGLVATYLVVQTMVPRKQTFKAGPAATSPSQKAVEHQVQLAKKQKTMSAPAPAKRITTTGLAAVVLPEMPDMPTTDTPNKMQGMGGNGTAPGLGTSGGAGSPGAAGAVMPFFGAKTALGLQGTFYDFKQTRGGTPTDMAADGKSKTSNEGSANNIYGGLVAKFIDRGMGEGSLGRYFVGPTPLYTTQIYIPQLNANEAPKAFQLEGKVQPRRWMVIYKGTVTPPESGKYRFVGGADDIIAVRFNGSLVFSNRGRKQKSYAYDGTYQGGSAVGDLMDVKAGVAYPISIVIGEQPGGSFMAYLLIEKVGAEYQKNDKGSPILPIFKFAPSSVTRGGGTPQFAPDTSWSIWKTSAPSLL